MSVDKLLCPARKAFFGLAIISSLAATTARADDDNEQSDCPWNKASEYVPSGQRITPAAVPGAKLTEFDPGLPNFPKFRPNGAETSLLSPDQKTLLVLISGYNLPEDPDGTIDKAASNQYVFVYDVSHGNPVKKQVLQLPNTFDGLAFSPDGHSFYVGGGADDDIHTYGIGNNGQWAENGTPIKLGHTGTNSITPTDVGPGTAGLAITADGKTLLAANVYNDSVSIVDLSRRAVTQELDLRPGVINSKDSGVAGGEYPYWIAIHGNDTAYVSSLRDRQVVEIQLSGQPQVAGRFTVKGSPNRMVMNKAQTRLYIASDFEDLITVFNTETGRVVQTISTNGPDFVGFNLKNYKGSAPNNLALSPDESVLYVTNAGMNCLAVISLTGGAKVVGLIPTQFYPSAVSVSGDGKMLYVVNQKSPTGPNPDFRAQAANQPLRDADYVYRLQHSQLLSFPVPDLSNLELLTSTVAANNRWITKPHPEDAIVMQKLHQRIKHIIYIVKENRTYDQILGDLDKGNGDPKLVQFGNEVTPNFHQISDQFVDLDNFYTPGDVSGNGWPWSTASRESDWGVKTVLLNYASGRGFAYDVEGTNRDVNVALPSVAQRKAMDPRLTDDPNILPGRADVAAPDGPHGEEGKGYIWDLALSKGLSIREYGFFSDNNRYSGTYAVPLERNPYAKHLQVQFPTKEVLIDHMDPYFRGFDNAFPDFWREKEWERELTQFEKNGKLPALNLVRFMHDHTGNYDTAIDGVNTPETQQADNDYAVGKLVDRIAHSKYKDDTLIFVIEDDSQAGADHIDTHRSTAYIAGPYVKQGAVVSTHYTTVNLIRTIEDILDIGHLNLYDSTFRPMTDCFDLTRKEWTYHSEVSPYLTNDTQLPVPRPATASRVRRSTHDAAYWAEKTKGFDFSTEDNLKDPDKYNAIIWEGLKNTPYPRNPQTGENLRKNRSTVLKKGAGGTET